IGVGRAATYSFLSFGAPFGAGTTASQFDRFMVVCQTIFPVVLYVDLLGSKVAGLANRGSSDRGSSDRTPQQSGGARSRNDAILEKMRNPLGISAHGPGAGILDSIANDFPEYSGRQSFPGNKAFPTISESDPV